MRTPLVIFSVLLTALFAGGAPAAAQQDMFDQRTDAARAQMMEQPETALAYAHEAEGLAARIDDPDARETAIITSLWLQVEALSRLNRHEDAAPLVADATARIERHAPNSQLHGGLLKARASIKSTNGEVHDALADLHTAHDIYRELDAPRDQAIVLQNLGMIYWRARDYARVLNYYDQANETYPDDPVLTYAGHNNRGNAYKEMGNFAAAEAAYEAALNTVLPLDSPTLEARLLTNIASAQFLQGKLEEAEASIERGMARGDKTDGGWERFLWGMKAKVALARNRPETARALIERTFEGENLATTSSIFRDFHDAARKVYARLGDHERAYQHLMALGRLEQEAMEAASSTNAALLGAKFDAANQELRITKLEADQLRNDRELQNSQNRIQLMTIGGVIAAAAALMILSALSYAFLTVRRSHKEVSDANDMLTHAAQHDALTGLPNRPSFRKRMRAALDAAARG
ncbi:MAG: tetratricopeptide repeat protein, partial [Pseudomonadota bacterium]